MNRQEWIDNLSTAMAGRVPRRGLLGWASALTFGLILDGAAGTGAARKGSHGGRRKGRDAGPRKGKNQEKGSNRPGKGDDEAVAAAAQDECSTTWPGSGKRAKRNRRHCRFIRRQCDGADPRDFCIVDGLFGSPPRFTKAAVCCDEGEVCCGNSCCGGANSACCDGACVALDDPRNCGSCDNRCDEGQVCRDRECVPDSDPCALGARADGEEDDCPSPCGPNSNCCGDGPPCPDGQLCWDGEHCSVCPPGQKPCQAIDWPEPKCVQDSAVCCPNGRVCAEGHVCCTSSAGVPYCGRAASDEPCPV